VHQEFASLNLPERGQSKTLTTHLSVDVVTLAQAFEHVATFLGEVAGYTVAGLGRSRSFVWVRPMLERMPRTSLRASLRIYLISGMA